MKWILLVWCWTLPPGESAGDYVFKLYSTPDLRLPVSQWFVAQTVPGDRREALVLADQPQAFFTLTVSNVVNGLESGYATAGEEQCP